MTDDIPETGAVFTFGKSHFAENEPSHFFIKNDPIVAISCGDEHSAVICQNGRVFVFGGNAWGQLGLGHKDEVTRPSCVKWLKPHRALFVACGRAHTVFVTDSNAIYTVGCNDEGQLGTGDLEHHTVPQFIELEGDIGPIRQLSAGSNHTAILTDDGRVFVSGSNTEGQLGLGEDTRSCVKFTELKFMEKIAFVECGYYHTVFITAIGAVFVTGDNENQKLGIPDKPTTVYVPTVLPLSIPIKSACCGAAHTFLLSMDESKILTFGSNEKGQLGLPKEVEHVTEPTEIDMEKMFDGYQLKLVACGAMHTAFVTDNGLLYACGESRHNKLCLEEIDDTDNANEAVPNQYTPKRVTAMNGHIVDNVACGGCHTLLTATKGSNADFTNNDFNVVDEQTRQISLTELPPLQKVPTMNKPEEQSHVIEDITNSNVDVHNTDNVNGNVNEESGSIDSLEANVSGSHIVNINDLENENGSTHDAPDINTDAIDTFASNGETKVMEVIENMDTMADKAENKVEEVVTTFTDKVNEKVEIVEEFVKKAAVVPPIVHDEAKKILDIPNKMKEVANSPPPKTPILPELLHIPDLSQISPVLSKHSDDGQKSEAGQSENETIPCGSDKSSPQAGKTKTQAVMPIVRSEDHIDIPEDAEHNEEGDVVVHKTPEKGRFARMFQTIRDKEHSCMGKGKVIEENVVETGAVFTFGKSHFAENEPSHFFIKNDPIVAISCGDEHSAVICQNGRVFVFGGNAWGQLGLGHKDEVTRPSCVKWLKPHRALFVACGRAHTVFVTDSNAIYTVGCNDEGQLGTGDLEHHTVPQFIELEGDIGPIRQLSAGSNHTAILTDDGRVFVSGSNTEGQLGLGEDTRSCVKFTELKFMEKIAFVECGYYHTVFITAIGAVFVTGDNENQKLGIPDKPTTVYVPTVLPLSIPIKSACCGAAHTFLLSMDESKILTFGSNEKGQLGLPKEVEHVTEPTEIDMEKMFDGYQLKLVACGAMHTAFVTDNGLLYACGESRHNKLCLEEIDDTDNANEAVPNQYTPKRVTAMNGHIVDNVACGGCHTLLTATKGSNADFTNNDFNVVDEQTRQISLTELPPLQKVPTMNKPEEQSHVIEDITNSNVDVHNTDNVNGNVNEESGSIDSLEANVSGSHIVNINDLENENGSTHDAPDINTDAIDTFASNGETKVMEVIENMDTMADKAENKVEEVVTTFTDKVNEKVEIVEEFVKKAAVVPPIVHDEAKKILDIPNKMKEVANSPPPKTPILPELLHIPDLSQISPVLSKHSDDGQKSEAGQSENETIPCGSDKSSPQAGKTKTQAVMPIVRSEDHIDIPEDAEHNEEGDVVVHKTPEKGRFARMFQTIRDKEHSCMGKGKVIEENVVENVHKGLDTAEDSIHKVEETVETEIRNQTSSRTCTIL